MGAPKKLRKTYKTPLYPWRKDIQEAELHLLGTYGLRNKHELWRHHSQLTKFRTIARTLLAKTETERAKLEKELLNKLYRLGITAEKATIDDVLDLSVEDLLDRRLQTQILRLGLAKSPQQARQFITHGHIAVNERRVTIPSYLVLRGEEKTIKYSPTSPLAKPDHITRKALETPAQVKKQAEATAA